MDQYKKLKKLIDKGHAVLLEIKDTKLPEYSKFRLVTKTSSEFTFYRVTGGDAVRAFKRSCFLKGVSLRKENATATMIQIMKDYDRSFDGKIVGMHEMSK